ncbi:alpha/beta hydrolase [Microbacterium sp. No. 7]|uniref:alpha/beta hydrolase n=1 Tax=Microbacterium sp. No. 7 TaxID=1714373 RepID=UPI0006CFB18F|nr:alpha/beta hydrolase [Microbacterium sp. No. 7]ALJ20459.1 esterase [Microbacterium sp. No. 7]
MTYRLDPELVPWISMLPQVSLHDIAAARRELAASLGAFRSAPPTGDVRVEDRFIPGPIGARDIRARIYTPADLPGPLPGMLYLHSGGFVLGSIDYEDHAISTIADGAGAVVVAVDYRLAPENPYPAGMEDCYAALIWMAENAALLDMDPDRIGVGGASAGGGLAAGVALLSRDRNGPRLCLQYLDAPELDDRMTTPSMTAYTDTPVWTRLHTQLSWEAYLAGADADGYAAPARMADLSGLPPAYIGVCQFDPLRDEAIDYAQRLAQSGTPTELHLYPGAFHGSWLVTEAAVSRRMVDDTVQRIRALLNQPTAHS